MKNKVLYCCFMVVTLMLNAQMTEKQKIDEVLDSWHLAAANADFEAYFGKMTKEGVFIGTDAMENWQNADFRAFSKPYFDRGKAWNFTAVQRNIYLDETKSFAGFDELLDTQMKICRGSGVLQKENGQWKIAHYVLSIAVPNEDVDQLVQIKEKRDDELLLELKKNQ
ncbi:nuclear transport factor 2 family protein [Flagellimonas hadalis]|uniref:Nuclear transport factor 2 family protein n=1 Tax=Flagellimonas hadalis TaxID=2597517 RepID=A0A5N5IX30_9FLAO|nr:nuclear transport factor 2 family protein [Allomuricauda hadalis]KAB5490903.1 nuclear transport factor 2 family protein [Allomuricauda hadalis]